MTRPKHSDEPITTAPALYAQDRFVRVVSHPIFAHLQPAYGFLHRYDGDEEMTAGWYITPGWLAFGSHAQRLNARDEIGYEGILFNGTLTWRWAEHPSRHCTRHCAACVTHPVPGSAFSRFTCDLLPDLYAIEPGGRHMCLIEPGMEADLLAGCQEALLEIEAKVADLNREQNRLRHIVVMLEPQEKTT